MRRRFTLIKPEGSETTHVRVLAARTLCGQVFDPGTAEKVKPLAATMRDLCPDCMAGHFRRRPHGK